MPFTYPDCHSCSNKCVETDGNRLSGKQSEPVCCTFSDGSLPSGSISTMLDSFRDRILHASSKLYPNHPAPNEQALRNLVGAWFEKILNVILWNFILELAKTKYDQNLCLVKLPNAGTLQFWMLFDKEAQQFLDDLFISLAANDITITTSNPDYVCVKVIGRNDLPDDFYKSIDEISLENLQNLSNKYIELKDKCHYDSILFGLSVKTALRPDRRYQIVYEGSIFKAFISHLKMRYWDKDLEIKYYGLTHKPPTAQDMIVLTNPAIDSLISVYSEPRRAVDELISCSSVSDVETAVGEWIISYFTN